MTCRIPIPLARNSIIFAAALAVLTAGAANRAAAEPAASEPAYDGLQQLLSDEGWEALAQGDYPRALRLFRRLVAIAPDDARALRECGRVAHALGRYAYAERTLARAMELRDGTPDPELHYLRGEALLVLGRRDAAMRELTVAEREIGPDPAERQPALWLARIYALRGEAERADSLYVAQSSSNDNPDDAASITMLRTEARIFAKDWAGAETLLTEMLERWPDHERARALLAWVLESRGELSRELDYRALIAEEWGDHPRKVLEYARALERAYDYPNALAHYRQARSLGVATVSDDIERLTNRLSPELAAGAAVRSDPSGSILEAFSGASIPLAARFRMALAGARETAEANLGGSETTQTRVSAWAIYTGSRGGAIAAGATARKSEADETDIGGVAMLRTSPRLLLQLHLRAEWNTAWRESSSTVREGGVIDGIEGQLYFTPTRRIVIAVSGQARRLGLRPVTGEMMAHATQLFGSAGVDYVLDADPSHVARGQLLDHDMLWPAPFANATVLSYRHNALTGDSPFGERLDLVDDSALDELSALLRRVVDERGRFAAQAVAGFGYDSRRQARAWRGGASMLFSPTASSRLSIDYSFASESGTGLTGRRHSATFVLHVDL